ncbi:hypothetical protein [Rhizobium esperanzae]|uniref:Uncharacterized protein n=1 Tax=Rhizobium esperanzae TaxID=1967781 RepID=A0A7W6R8U8_9HYPH|nr:hypothetical protein [Rhizobium esperanzae]MBB4238970.1 hypothetical protein [Rhizobium esperanzae]
MQRMNGPPHALPEAGRSAQRRQMAATTMDAFRYRHPAFVKT